ncbi:MAG TPA: hypothetical protein VMZ53_09965 [Kofleriaceae bacterium]|nr:hypothetical protein [Kofleriaceae bacterium]
MRRLAVALVVLLAFVAVGGDVASAQLPPAKPYAQPGPPKPGAANSQEPWQPPPKPTEQQQWQEMKNQERPGRSGFWTSPYPAKHGAYRWRLLGVGVVILAIMGALMVWLIRRPRSVTQRPRV